MQNKDNLLNHLKKTHVILFLFGILGSLLNFILPIVMTRTLNMSDLGIYKTFFTLLITIPFLTLAGGHFGYLYHSRGDYSGGESLEDTFKTNYILMLVQSGIIGFAYFLYFNIWGTISSLEASTEWMMVVIGILSIPSSFYSEVSIVNSKVLKGGGLYFLFDASKVITLVAFSYYYSIQTALIAFFILCCTSFTFSFLFSWKSYFRKAHFMKKEAIRILHYSIPLSLSSLLFFGIEKFDQLILLKVLDLNEFVLLSVGCFFFPPVMILENALQKRLIPLVSSDYISKNVDQLSEKLRWYIERMALLIIPVVIFSFIYGEDIITFLFGERFYISSQYFKVFLFSYLLYLIPNDLIQKSISKNRQVLWINLVVFALYSISLLLYSNMNSEFNPITFIYLSIIFRGSGRLITYYFGLKNLSGNLVNTIPFGSICAYLLLAFLSSYIVLKFDDLFSLHLIIKGFIFSILSWGSALLFTTRYISRR